MFLQLTFSVIERSRDKQRSRDKLGNRAEFREFGEDFFSIGAGVEFPFDVLHPVRQDPVKAISLL